MALSFHTVHDVRAGEFHGVLLRSYKGLVFCFFVALAVM